MSITLQTNFGNGGEYRKSEKDNNNGLGYIQN